MYYWWIKIINILGAGCPRKIICHFVIWWLGCPEEIHNISSNDDIGRWTLIVTYQIFPTTISTAPIQIHRLLMGAEHPLFFVVTSSAIPLHPLNFSGQLVHFPSHLPNLLPNWYGLMHSSMHVLQSELHSSVGPRPGDFLHVHCLGSLGLSGLPGHSRSWFTYWALVEYYNLTINHKLYELCWTKC